MHGYWLVTAATDEPAVNAAVFADGQRLGIWVNAADDPTNCSVYLPAVHREGPVTVAISTAGASPALASSLRDRIARLLGPAVGKAALCLAAERRAVQATGVSTEDVDWQPRIAELLNDTMAGAVGGVPS